MAEVAQQTQQEFWRPPIPMNSEIAEQTPIPVMAEACPRCGTEFLLGSRFCHTCGGRRPEALNSTAQADAAAVARVWVEGIHTVQVGMRRVRAAVAGFSWSKIQFPSWTGYLHFHEIKSRTGLSSGSLIAFVIGLGCVAGAMLVGLMTARTLVDWQAIQIYRAEWLLGAGVSFLAGILLKKSGGE